MSLWRSIVDGLGLRVGSELAQKGIEELTEKVDEEARAKEVTSRKRKLAGAVVVISVLGLLALSGALTEIFKWALGAAFIVGLAGGGWYLVRNRWFAMRASMVAKRTEKLEQKTEADKQRSLEQQLAELKRKKAQSEK